MGAVTKKNGMKPIRPNTLKALIFARLGQGRKDQTIITEVKRRFPKSKFNRSPKHHLSVYRARYKARQAEEANSTHE